MIVLDEQLSRASLRAAIRHWYRGAVVEVTQLRPGTQILDEAIPALLRTLRQPTFVTINVVDFWRRLPPDRRFGIICLVLAQGRADDVPALLRRVLLAPPFSTRRGRMGKIARVTREQIHFYTVDSWAIQLIPLRQTPG